MSSSSSSFTLLYLSRSLAAWANRSWQFVGSLFLVKLDSRFVLSPLLDILLSNISESLQLMAAYGLISNLTLMFLGNALGRMVDTLPRDKMVTLAVITQNLAVSLTCLIMSVYFSVGLHISIPLYCTILYCTILYCTVLYCAVLCC